MQFKSSVHKHHQHRLRENVPQIQTFIRPFIRLGTYVSSSVYTSGGSCTAMLRDSRIQVDGQQIPTLRNTLGFDRGHICWFEHLYCASCWAGIHPKLFHRYLLSVTHRFRDAHVHTAADTTQEHVGSSADSHLSPAST